MLTGEIILSLRKKAGLSQDELAQKLNVTRQSVSKWESSQCMPDTDKIILLSDIFGVSTDYILKGENSGNEKAGNKKTNSVFLLCVSAALCVLGVIAGFCFYNTPLNELSVLFASLPVTGGILLFIFTDLHADKSVHNYITAKKTILMIFIPALLLIPAVLLASGINYMSGSFGIFSRLPYYTKYILIILTGLLYIAAAVLSDVYIYRRR